MKSTGNPDKLYDQIVTAIRDGHYSPGQKLAPERALATEFNITRSSVQRVLEKLEQQNLIQRKTGSGTFVSEEVAQVIEMEDLHVDLHQGNFIEHVEARSAFEPWVVAHAAIFADQNSMKKLRKHLDEVKNPKNWLEYKRSVYLFFRCLYEIAGNSFLLTMFDNIIRHREAVEYGSRNAKTRVIPVIVNSMSKSLEDILQAVESNDPDAAERASREFLDKMLISVSS